METSVDKKYIKIGNKQIFVQVLGAGPVLALLHPSPHSSDMLLPFAERLAKHYTVICIDTPGYGKSDALDSEPEHINVYSDMLYELFEAMQISNLGLYGSATGAQIAIRYALDYPESVSHLFLDNAAHFEDGLRDKILAHYFPDLTPTKMGDHLEALWDIVSNLFLYFPWCFKTSEFALNRSQLPAVVLHNIGMDFLKAGANYHWAYRAAFQHERAEHVQQLVIPTNIFRWEGSIILPYIDALIDHNFPNNIETINLNKDPNQRTEDMVAHIVSKKNDHNSFLLSEGIGETYHEKTKEPLLEAPPEISLDGSYLKEAWHLIYKRNKEASPQHIQQELIHWYEY